MTHRVRIAVLRLSLPLALAALVSLHQPPAAAQDRLRAMPGFDRYHTIGRQIAGSVRGGALSVTWAPDSRSFVFSREGKRFRYDVAGREATEIGPAEEEGSRAARRRRSPDAPERGRQFETAESPDKKLRAFYRNRNVWLSDAAGGELRVTTDGDEATRVKYGTASWVYGEELDQQTAMWWSPDSRKLAFYRFDEKDVPDYFLQLNQTKLQSTIEVEAYPKAGAANPVVDLFIYDVPTRKTTRVDVRSGMPFDNAVVGHYVYRIAWSPDGRELLFTRMNRRQNVLELAAANPETGATRVVVREEWPTGWVEPNPGMHLLSDGRFIWESERNGWNNAYLYDLDGTLIRPLTTHSTFELSSIVKIDAEAGVLFYMARDGDNPMKLQLHRAGLDGTGDVRLTDPAFHHTVGTCMPQAPPAVPDRDTCGISPDNRFFVDVYQTHDTPPATRLADAATGQTAAELAQSDVSRFNALGLKKTELFTYKAADGRTTLYGLIHFPSDFDPAKKYPVLVNVYGGPASASSTARETFVLPNANTEYGFLVVNLESRAAPGRGKRALDAIYLRLGQVEVDDMAEGVRSLWNRPYVDRARVGIYGSSYGGYASAMSLLRYPHVYAAASASSPVTAWYHYDTIYTERYMWIPQANTAGYAAGSAMTYVGDLKGRLMIYYGTADNNVHPSNAMQLIDALQKAGKSFDVQVGPDRGHGAINPERMMEFFIENLVLRPALAGVTSF